MHDITIAGRLIGPDHDPYVIAEIGQNHNGDVYTAVRMIGMANKCGADAVKFQLRNADIEICKSHLDAPHPNPGNAFGATYREHRLALDMSITDIRHLANRIQYNEWPIQWFATPCFVGAVEQLESLNAPCYKIASKDLTNLPLIAEAAGTGKPVILSTGMATMQEIEQALTTVGSFHDDVIVMQCTSQYPCPNENANIAAMVMIQDEFQCNVGFSDHTIGILAPSIAVSLGAVMIEKHITLSRAMPGTDHAGAVENDGLRRIVRDVHETRKLVGSYVKERSPQVEPAMLKLAGSLVCTRTIDAGEIIREEDIAIKAPGGGLTWAQRSFVIGRQAIRAINPDEQIKTSDVL